MGRYDAVLLDVDGTLVDSNDAHAQAFVDVIADAGYPVAFWQVRRLVGMGGAMLLEHLLELEEGGDENVELGERKKHRFQERYVHTVAPIEGAVELVERLDAAKIPVVVATSASEADLKPLLERAGLESLIERAVNADDAEHAKPCADVVVAACEKAGVAPSQAVLIGDTPYDHQAARRAGVDFIAVATGGWTRRDFEGAVAFVRSVASLGDLLLEG